MVTGICVKAWQSKSGTGYNEEGNSPKVNNLGKLAINELLSSKLIVRKKHHQRTQLNSGIDKVRPYNSDTTVTKKEAELSASFFVFRNDLQKNDHSNNFNTRGRYFLIRALSSSNSEAVIVIIDISDVMLVSINEIFVIDFKINH